MQKQLLYLLRSQTAPGDGNSNLIQMGRCPSSSAFCAVCKVLWPDNSRLQLMISLEIADVTAWFETSHSHHPPLDNQTFLRNKCRARSRLLKILRGSIQLCWKAILLLQVELFRQFLKLLAQAARRLLKTTLVRNIDRSLLNLAEIK